jgi:hypothetical protein
MNRAREWLQKIWAGSSIMGKVWLPAMLFGVSWMVAKSPIHNLFSALFNLVLAVPLVLLGIFFLVVPGELRPDGDTICYRKWFRWQIFPSGQVEEISKTFLSLGAIKLEGQPERLLFFIEPENRDLLGFGQHGAESLQAWMDRAGARHKHAHPIVYVLAGVGGFVTGLLLSRIPQLQTGSSGPSWPAMITDFENHYAIVLKIVIVLVLLVPLIRGVHMNRSERGVVAFMIGFAVAGFFIRPQ